ncbi:LytR family transcriptional regulator [Candidatus Shapirobacteria bacterium]|nr:LytR family transcriptional regulator [Candidatus Shapirobacteria bacterium]
MLGKIKEKIRPSRKTVLILIMVFLLAGALASTYYFYKEFQRTSRLLQDPTEAARQETNVILAKLGKMMELPVGEEPTMATIIDAEKLKDQPFFARTQNGDKVLLYANAKKAILYRPGENKIVEVAPLNIGTPSAQPVGPKIRVALYNGTDKTDLTQKAEKALTAKYADIDVVAKENAKKRDYEKTLIVDLSGTKKEVAEALAKELGGEVGTLPAEETAPVLPTGQEAELLVILGNNYSQ